MPTAAVAPTFTTRAATAQAGRRQPCVLDIAGECDLDLLQLRLLLLAGALIVVADAVAIAVAATSFVASVVLLHKREPAPTSLAAPRHPSTRASAHAHTVHASAAASLCSAVSAPSTAPPAATAEAHIAHAKPTTVHIQTTHAHAQAQTKPSAEAANPRHVLLPSVPHSRPTA